MILALLALILFIAAAVIAGIQRSWSLMLIAIGLALIVLDDLPVQIG